LVLTLLLLAAAGLCAAAISATERNQPLNDDWRFHRGDEPDAWQPSFDDRAWRMVDVPHDWSIEDLPEAPGVSGPFDPQSPGARDTGYTVGGVGWYRKTFKLPSAARGKRVGLMFDGAYMDATVWLNGVQIARHPYGYTAFHMDLTPHALYGPKPNVLAVRLDTSGRTSRWYSGSGITRCVEVCVTHPVHAQPWGIAITSIRSGAHDADVTVKTVVVNDGQSERSVTVASRIVDPRGDTVASISSSLRLAAGAEEEFVQNMLVAKPLLWSLEKPHQHHLVTTVVANGHIADVLATEFGIRFIDVCPETGLRLNGAPIKLRGGCVHHDNGCLGARALPRAEERRVALLKASGFNAVRTAHNPPSTAFLDACDRLGMLVLDEAFDCWSEGKNADDYGRFFNEHWREDIDAMVLRDRNHPCVFAWSVGNEIPNQHLQATAAAAAMLVHRVRGIDPSRPVAVAALPDAENWEKLDGLFTQVDLAGYNYRRQQYDADHKRVPGRLIFGSESFSHASEAFESWMGVFDRSWVLGDFVWTAMDHLGEACLGSVFVEGDPGPEGWPWTVSNCGDLDLIGMKRPQSYYRDALWGVGTAVSCFVEPPARIFGGRQLAKGWGWRDERACWTWPGAEGDDVTVRVYSSRSQVRLYLNGRDLGAQPVDRDTRFEAIYTVPYEPGELCAVAYAGNGKEAGRWVLRTAGPAAGLRLRADRSAMLCDGQDLAFVTVEVVDAAGVLAPGPDVEVSFSVTGPARISAVGNADPTSVASFTQPRRRTFRGRCLVVVQAGRKPGAVTLTAEADGLAPSQVTLNTDYD
jgi:beta-galactosidase